MLWLLYRKLSSPRDFTQVENKTLGEFLRCRECATYTRDYNVSCLAFSLRLRSWPYGLRSFLVSTSDCLQLRMQFCETYGLVYEVEDAWISGPVCGYDSYAVLSVLSKVFIEKLIVSKLHLILWVPKDHFTIDKKNHHWTSLGTKGPVQIVHASIFSPMLTFRPSYPP